MTFAIVRAGDRSLFQFVWHPAKRTGRFPDQIKIMGDGGRRLPVLWPASICASILRECPSVRNSRRNSGRAKKFQAIVGHQGAYRV